VLLPVLSTVLAGASRASRVAHSPTAVPRVRRIRCARAPLMSERPPAASDDH
jgi:hypothetical protein